MLFQDRSHVRRLPPNNHNPQYEVVSRYMYVWWDIVLDLKWQSHLQAERPPAARLQPLLLVIRSNRSRRPTNTHDPSHSETLIKSHCGDDCTRTYGRCLRARLEREGGALPIRPRPLWRPASLPTPSNVSNPSQQCVVARYRGTRKIEPVVFLRREKD